MIVRKKHREGLVLCQQDLDALRVATADEEKVDTQLFTFNKMK